MRLQPVDVHEILDWTEVARLEHTWRNLKRRVDFHIVFFVQTLVEDLKEHGAVNLQDQLADGGAVETDVNHWKVVFRLDGNHLRANLATLLRVLTVAVGDRLLDQPTTAFLGVRPVDEVTYRVDAANRKEGLERRGREFAFRNTVALLRRMRRIITQSCEMHGIVRGIKRVELVLRGKHLGSDQIGHERDERPPLELFVNPLHLVELLVGERDEVVILLEGAGLEFGQRQRRWRQLVVVRTRMRRDVLALEGGKLPLPFGEGADAVLRIVDEEFLALEAIRVIRVLPIGAPAHSRDARTLRALLKRRDRHIRGPLSSANRKPTCGRSRSVRR